MPGPIFSMPNRFIWTDSPQKKRFVILQQLLTTISKFLYYAKQLLSELNIHEKIEMWHIVCNMLRWWISWYIEWLYQELTSNYHELASKSVPLVVVQVPVFLALLPLRSPAPSPCAASRRLVALLPAAARSYARRHAPPCASSSARSRVDCPPPRVEHYRLQRCWDLKNLRNRQTSKKWGRREAENRVKIW